MSDCLHCGKQLALLKTIAGSTQFCSEDHRQSYQDHSNRLALNRLLEAKDKKKSRRQPVLRPGPINVEDPAPSPPQTSFLMQNPGQPLSVRRRPAVNTAPLWRPSVTLYPRVPPLESDSIFSTSSPAIVRQEFQEDAGTALGTGRMGGGGSQSGSANILVLSQQILKAERPLPLTQTIVTDTAASNSAMLKHAGSNVIRDGARSEQTVSEFNQDQKPQSRFRLAPKEQAGPKFPMAGPMDSRDFLQIAEGNVPLEPYSLDVLHFYGGFSLDGLSLSTLTTTGFEGLDDLIAEHTPPPVELVPEPEPVPLVAPARLGTAFLPVPSKPVAPAHAKIIQGYPPLATAARKADGHLVFDGKPLRPRMVPGPNPNAPKPVVAQRSPAAPAITTPVAAPVPAPISAPLTKPAVASVSPAATPVRATVIIQKPVQATPVVSAPVVSRPSQTVSTPSVSQPSSVPMPQPVRAPVAKPAAPPPPAPRLVPQPSVTVKPPVAPTITVRPAAAASIATPSTTTVLAEKQAAPPTIELITKPTPAAAPAVAPEKPKISIRPAATPAVTSAPTTLIDRDKRPAQRPVPNGPSRPAMAARDGNALTVERLEPEIALPPTPQFRPKLMPIRKSEPAYSTAIAVEDFPTLGMRQMEPSPLGKFWSNATNPVKAVALAAAVVVILSGGYFVFRPSQSSEAAYVPGPTAITEGSAPGMVIGGGGWTTNWGSDAPVNKGKQISLFRPSMSMTDYRFEFRGQIERKAVGWIFRAANPKNYHVAKIEIIKPGLNPIVALVKYSVIKGVEGTHTQVMLPSDFKMDTAYRVRMDVRGSKFTTYIQDKLVDYWSDDQIQTGGAGFFTVQGERAQIRSSQIAYLGAN